MLFSIVLESVLWRAGIGTSVTTFRNSFQVFGFDDDIDIMGSSENDVDLSPLVHIDDEETEVIEEFVYLDSSVTADNETSREIQRPIMDGNSAKLGLRKSFRLNKIRSRTK